MVTKLAQVCWLVALQGRDYEVARDCVQRTTPAPAQTAKYPWDGGGWPLHGEKRIQAVTRNDTSRHRPASWRCRMLRPP